MINHNTGLVPSFPVILVLRLGLLDRLYYIIYCLRNVVAAGFHEFILKHVSKRDRHMTPYAISENDSRHERQRCPFYISQVRCYSLSETWRTRFRSYLRRVYPNLQLVMNVVSGLGDIYSEIFLGLFRVKTAALNQRPKGRVVKIIDMA